MPVPIRIGILHSLQGPMALSEAAMADAALLAVEEINASGGLLGRPVQAVIADGESDPAVFQSQAWKLIQSDKVQALFGCWTSSSRKAVKTVVENEDSLLWYPVQYEGLEQSPNIVYTGSCLNQQIQPFIEWCLAQGWKRFFLAGSDYVFPHAANKLIHSLLHEVDAQVVGEKYFSLDCDDFTAVVPLLDETRPDILINTVNGSGNDRLFEQVFSSPPLPWRLQAFSTSCTEIDFARIGNPAQGHLSCWSYYQSLQSPENEAFIATYRTRFGHDRLVSDPLATAYAQIHLWAAIAAAREIFSPGELKNQLTGQPIRSPLGQLEVGANRHVARKALIGRYMGDGRHDILWQSQGEIHPLPWMGMENVDIPSRALILDLLEQIPEELDAGIRLKNEIHERRLAEEELRRKSEELELYFTSSLDLLCIANLDGRFIRLNPEWENVLGYSVPELKGRMFLDFVHPEDVESTIAAVARLENQEQVLNFENRFRCKDGEYRWIEWRSRPLGRQIYAAARDVTERKRAESKLQESEENLARTLQSIGDGVISTDRQGRIVRLNPVAEKLCGWKESAAKGLPLGEVFRIVHAMTLEAVQDPVKKVFETGQVIGLANHTLLLGKDGVEHQIADSAAPIFDREGNITGAVLVFRDVTEEYARAERLRISEERLDRAMAVKNEGIWDWNLVTNETFFDERYYTMAGYAPNEFPQEFPSWAERVHPEDLQHATSAIQAYLAGKIDVFDVEFRFKHKNGSWIWIQGRGKIVERAADGSPLRMIGTHADITERRQAQDALLESEEMQRKLLQTVPDLIIWTDLEGTITYVNEQTFPGWENLPRESISGRNIFSFVAPQDLPRAMENARLRFEKNIGTQEYQLQFDDGAVVHAEINGAVIRDKESRAMGMVYVIRDVSDRKRAEQEQEKLQSQFLQAQKMESLGVLAGGVAHDFNNLLHAMGGNIERILQDTPANHPNATRLQTVIKSMEKAAQLVRQLLLFGRKTASRRVRVNLNQEVEDAKRILERTIPKMIALELKLAREPWPLFADPVQIEQVLLNLVTNAVDAMPNGGKLMIETSKVVLDEDFVMVHSGSSNGQHVLLTVTDTGCGMDREVLDHIFDPFYTTKETGKGTGLGLASVYGIVQAHGGCIHCYSEPGLGTTFRIFWPAVDKEDVCPVSEPREHTLQGGSETILVVDDEPEIRELTQEALEALGYTVKSAANGEEALTVYQDHGRDIALVLLDLNMPGMGGYKCLQELLALDPAVKVVISSGYTANGHGKGVESSGARGFISKPYQLRELAVIMRKVIDAELGDEQPRI